MQTYAIRIEKQLRHIKWKIDFEKILITPLASMEPDFETDDFDNYVEEHTQENHIIHELFTRRFNL